MRLRDLDEKWVPEMGRRLDALLGRIPDPLPEPEGPLPLIKRLRRLDDRWAAGGPLALLRDVPQLGAVVVAALVLAGAVTVNDRGSDRARTEATEGTEDDDTRLGPEIGESPTTYIRDVHARLARLAPGQPDGTTVAVVSFGSYLTPEQVRDLVGPSQVKRIFYRPQLPLRDTPPQTTAVEDLLRDSRKEFKRVAAVQKREERALRSVIATNVTDPVQKAADEKQAAYHKRYAAILSGRCPCIFAVVVRTRYKLLANLLGVQGVRAVDPGRPGAEIDDYDYAGLLPEEKRTVTGGNQS